jgi:hypothetical protein
MTFMYKQKVTDIQPTDSPGCCMLCGEPGCVRFKNYYVCESCLEYIKTHC